MSKEAKGWLFATIGIAFLVTALLARSWRNWDEPPAASISNSLESVEFERRPSQVVHQPTILRADAAASPLSGEGAVSPFQDRLTQPVTPLSWETTISVDPSSPSATEPRYGDFLPIPPTRQLQRP